MENLIVNLSGNSGFVKQQVDRIAGKDQDWWLIDFAGAKFEFENITCFSARIHDPNNEIERKANYEFVHKVGELSLLATGAGKNIRQIQINGLPVFWLTALSVKHPFKHWLYGFFFFKCFVEAKPDFFKSCQRVIILVPAPFDLFNNFLQQHSPWLEAKTSIISEWKKPRFALAIRWLQAVGFCFRYLYSYLFKPSPQPGTDTPADFDFMLLRYGNAHSSSLLQQEVKKLLSSKGRLIDAPVTDLSPNIDKRAFPIPGSYPGPWKVLALQFQICRQSFVVHFKKRAAFNKRDFWAGLVYSEIFNALGNFQLLLVHQWLTGILKKFAKPVKVFYEDEMYRWGRVISSAAMLSKNPRVKAIAYQHGNISEGHTVYRISDAEIRNSAPGKNDALPMPGIFLVWGEYFRKQFLEWSSYDPNRVVVAGNPVYLGLKKKFAAAKSPSGGLKRILWCATSLEFAKSEYEIICSTLEQRQYTLIIRMHPNYRIKDRLQEIIPAQAYAAVEWDSIPGIYDSIHAADLVVCSGHSTVFIDCIILNKPVIRLFNSSILNDRLDKAQFSVKNASNAKEFKECFDTISSMPDFHPPSHYLYLDDDRGWQTILKSEPAITRARPLN